MLDHLNSISVDEAKDKVSKSLRSSVLSHFTVLNPCLKTQDWKLKGDLPDFHFTSRTIQNTAISTQAIDGFSKVMYEDETNEKKGSYISEKDRVLAWTQDVADSTAKEASKPTSHAPHSEARHVEQEPPTVVINQVVTTPAVVITRVRPASTPKDEISTKAVIGTVLGGTAGAVVAYGTYCRSPYFLYLNQTLRLETCPRSITLGALVRLHMVLTNMRY